MIYLNNLTRWTQNNETLKKQLNLGSSSVQVRAYSDLTLALLENIGGTMSFLAHKKSVLIHKGVSSCFEFLIPQFYREVIQIQSVQKNDLVSYDLNNLKKDTNLALIFEDHPVTAEEYPWQKMDEELNARKIFSFRVSFHRFKSDRSMVVEPYSIRICCDQNLVYAICGEKYKVPAFLSPSLNHPFPLIYKPKAVVEALDVVSDFEKWMNEKFLAKPYLPFLVSRYPDRSLHILKTVTADYLKNFLIQKSPKYAEHVLTLSECEHGFMRPLSSWWEGAPSLEDQVGFIGFSSECLSWPETKTFVEQGHASAGT